MPLEEPSISSIKIFQRRDNFVVLELESVNAKSKENGNIY